ncbi:hypothetical protein VP01_1461g2 [Puccinia sorghi]|uniref:Uncharacterized protein n=1 Tax=Puccinia sorghi TaxID=27349 RepID=A0A0L6VJY6_9BASI|nr:hypothetical protein VP01_1461g2 [Puccinia sorghi]
MSPSPGIKEFTPNEEDSNDPEALILKEKRKVLVTIKYSVFVEKRFEGHSKRYVRVVPFGLIDPMNIDIQKWAWSDFKRQVMCHLCTRPKLMDLLEQLESKNVLKWIGYIINNRLFPKKTRTEILYETQFASFAQEAFKSRPSEVTIEITMDNPSTNEKILQSASEVNNLLNLEFGTEEEQALARRSQIRKQANPRAEDATMLQQVVAELYHTCVKNSEGSSEGLTFVNPNNPAQYIRVGHEQLTAWAKAMIVGEPGVDKTHPPKTQDFEWLPVPGTISHVTFTPPDSSASEYVNSGNSTSSIPAASDSSNSRPDKRHRPSESGGSQVNNIPSQFAHFNNDNTPMTRTRVEMQGTMTGFLGYSMIPFDDHHTRILIEYHRIHHWTFFKRSTMVELLGMGFAPGPARLLIDGVPLFEHVLKTTPEDPSFGDL